MANANVRVGLALGASRMLDIPLGAPWASKIAERMVGRPVAPSERSAGKPDTPRRLHMQASILSQVPPRDGSVRGQKLVMSMDGR